MILIVHSYKVNSSYRKRKLIFARGHMEVMVRDVATVKEGNKCLLSPLEKFGRW